MSERLFDLKEGAQVGIVSGSASDKETVDKVTAVLDQLGVSWEFNVLSAHRAPNKLARYMKEAKPRGLKAMVGVAGLAAALPGVMASHTTLPVIGVPCAGGPLSGVDALCSIVQMPSGIPVATVAIDGAANAGILAAKMLAIGNPELLSKIEAYKDELKDGVMKKKEKLEKVGYKEYMGQ